MSFVIPSVKSSIIFCKNPVPYIVIPIAQIRSNNIPALWTARLTCIRLICNIIPTTAPADKNTQINLLIILNESLVIPSLLNTAFKNLLIKFPWSALLCVLKPNCAGTSTCPMNLPNESIALLNPS